MFVFDRSAAAVILPLALLIAAVLWSGGSSAPAPATAQPRRLRRKRRWRGSTSRAMATATTAAELQAVAVTLLSRCFASSAMVGKSNSSVRSTSPG